MTEEQWEGLLNHLSEGGSVRGYVRETGIDRSGIFWTLARDPEKSDQYARAKSNGIEARLDAARETALTMEDVQRAKLVIDLDKWEASKLLPRKYGDKLDVTSKGEAIGKVYLVPPGEEDWTEKV